MDQSIKELKWFNSVNIPVEFQCGIVRLEMFRSFLDTEQLNDLSVTAYIVCNQVQMHDPPLSTYYGVLEKNIVNWDHVITFPLKIRELSYDSVISFTIWLPNGKPFAGTTTKVFDEHGCLKQGKQKLLLFPGAIGDPNVVYKENNTPGDYYHHFADIDYEFQLEKTAEQYRMRSNSIGKPDVRQEWLDRMLLTKLESSQVDQQREMEESWGQSIKRTEMQKFSYLIVEFPSLTYPIIHEERQYQNAAVQAHCPPTSMQDVLRELTTVTDNIMDFTLNARNFNPACLTIVVDWDMDADNLYEEQNRRLNHNARRGTADSTVKPNKDQKKRLDSIINSVQNTMSTEDMDFLYRFRYSLTENEKALIKFLYAVNWEDDTEVEELPILFSKWKEHAPIDVADALKLLGK
jgi:phosphatidylinositol 3-kinase